MEALLMRLLCGEEAFDVELRPGPAGARVTVAGQAFDLQVEPVGPGVFLYRAGERRETFHCARDGDVIHLFWRGRVYRLEEETEARRAAHRHAGGGGLEAPMPGKVIAVKVAPGDTVSKGDELLVVEAMKMENAVRAPRDGRVKSVLARVGDMVSPGVVLVELE
jgi:3-methylcrotonyl-CoA carboxylase alpha subunit